MTPKLLEFLVLGIPVTIGVTVAAFFIGMIAGIPIMLARTAPWPSCRYAFGGLVAVVRSIPAILWLFIAYFGIGSGLITLPPLICAVLVFGVIAAFNMAEIYRSGMLGVPRGQWEAAAALNLGYAATLRDVALPQMFRVSQPAAASYLIGLTKDSAIASTIGVTELAYRGNLVAQMTFEGIKVFGLVGIIYIMLSVPVAWLSRYVDKKLRAKIAR